jgi:hypothetical protein
MNIQRIGTLPSTAGPAEYFSGVVLGDQHCNA